MPFNELRRQVSWPPTVLRMRDEAAEGTEEIDDDPFSFFLTSPEDMDDFLDEDLSAGIETPESKPAVREVSPSALQRALLDVNSDSDEENDTFGLAMPLSLKDFTSKQFSNSSGRKSRTGQRKEELKGLGIVVPELAASRGRLQVRLTPSRNGRGRGRGQTRSLSARRSQSWRLPSPDIYSIKEERESDDEKKGDEKEEVEIKIDVLGSASAPATGRIEPMMAEIPKKTKKRVHWAM